MKRALALLGGFFLYSTAALAQPAISFQANSVTATGITPGGYATLFGITKTQPNWRVEVNRVDARIADGDSDGVVVFALEGGIPTTSLWAAVDESTGAVGLARPPGVNLRALRVSTGALRAIEGGTVRGLTFDCSVLEVLVVRPGQGSWAQTVFDGGKGDADELAQRLIDLDLSWLKPVNGSPEPEGEPLAPGDLIVLVDPDQMGVAAVTVGAAAR